MLESEVPQCIPRDAANPVVQAASQDIEARCINYPEHACRRAMSRVISAAPGNLTQETIINNDSDENMEGDEDFLFEEQQETGKPYDSGSIYANLHPIFKETCAVMDLNHSEEDMQEFKTMISTLLAKQKEKLFGHKKPKGRNMCPRLSLQTSAARHTERLTTRFDALKTIICLHFMNNTLV